MAENVTIQLNITTGEILIQAPAESLDTIFSKLESFVPNMVEVHEKLVSDEPNEKNDTQNSPDDENSDKTKDNLPPVEDVKGGSKKKRSSSSKKPESLKMVELGLEETQRQDFRKFYTDKNPKSQNEQILVIMYWLKNNANKNAFSKDEIYTGLRTVDAKVPTRISSVLSNLGIDGKIISNDDGFHLHHTGEDFVKFDLPKKDGQK
ncbi:hypothetical protein [Caproiciproducens sp.]